MVEFSKAPVDQAKLTLFMVNHHILSFAAGEGTMREFAEAVTTLLAATPTVW